MLSPPKTFSRRLWAKTSKRAASSSRTTPSKSSTWIFSSENMLYQLGWTTLPGLRGLSCSEFRATPTTAPDNERGVALGFNGDDERDAFLRQIEEHFAERRFTNAADAFDTVKVYVLEQA